MNRFMDTPSREQWEWQRRAQWEWQRRAEGIAAQSDELERELQAKRHAQAADDYRFRRDSEKQAAVSAHDPFGERVKLRGAQVAQDDQPEPEVGRELRALGRQLCELEKLAAILTERTLQVSRPIEQATTAGNPPEPPVYTPLGNDLRALRQVAGDIGRRLALTVQGIEL